MTELTELTKTTSNILTIALCKSHKEKREKIFEDIKAGNFPNLGRSTEFKLYHLKEKTKTKLKNTKTHCS